MNVLHGRPVPEHRTSRRGRQICERGGEEKKRKRWGVFRLAGVKVGWRGAEEGKQSVALIFKEINEGLGEWATIKTEIMTFSLARGPNQSEGGGASL